MFTLITRKGIGLRAPNQDVACGISLVAWRGVSRTRLASLQEPESLADGNVTELGDASREPGKSALFLFTAQRGSTLEAA